VDVLGDTIVLSRRQVVVDDMLDVGDIETTSGNASSNQDGATTGTEGATRSLLVMDPGMRSLRNLKSILTLTLGTIGVNRSHRQTLVVEEVVDHVALDLGVGEDQGALGAVGEDQVKQSLALGTLLDEDDLLLDVLMRAADAADLDANLRRLLARGVEEGRI
jgi:hypothetical protein